LGKTPLHYASQHGYLDILKELYDLATPSLITPSATECFTLPVMSLLHLASLNNQLSVVNWLQHDLVYPPHIKCRRAVHQNSEITLEEYPEDTASSRGHLSLKTSLQSYRQVSRPFSLVPLIRVTPSNTRAGYRTYEETTPIWDTSVYPSAAPLTQGKPASDHL
jgi:hypothetical protein